MISPDEALVRILQQARPLGPAQEIPLGEAHGRILAEDIVADRDIPPFDRVCMDGYACRHDSVEVNRALRVRSEVRAGHHAGESLTTGELARVMTGAPLPEGADTVVPQEVTTVEAERVRILDLPPLGCHIAHRGSDRRAGERILSAGSVITPIGIAVLATVGRTRVPVVPRPRMAIVSTGDEIVPVEVTPGPWQIRDSNAHSLSAQAKLAGFDQIELSYASDEFDELVAVLRRALTSDVVIISGGVSLGQYDRVPEVLARLDVRRHFHEVAQKPGKPLWFGSRGDCLVFGTPGNPLATVLTFDRYILPALRILSGLPTRRALFAGRLTRSIRTPKGGRETFVFARARADGEGVFEVTPLVRTGAADVFNTARANAMIRMAPNQHLPSGHHVEFTLLGVFEGVY